MTRHRTASRPAAKKGMSTGEMAIVGAAVIGAAAIVYMVLNSNPGTMPYTPTNNGGGGGGGSSGGGGSDNFNPYDAGGGGSSF